MSLPRTALLFFLSVLAPASGRAADAGALWKGGVQALFDQNCVKCHGVLEQKSGLELDTLDAVLKGSEDGPVVVPGHPEKSPLIDSLVAGADPHMPPKKQLSAADAEKLRAWVLALGEKPETAESKPVAALVFENATAAIDHFIEAGWRAANVEPAPACDERTFLRRLYLDLAGRIPTGEEVAAFLADNSAKKREALVDRLLASEEYPRTFREVWDVILMGRNAGRRDQRRRDSGWHGFLETAFKNNRPWNQVVRDMVVARPGKGVDKGAHWFLFERKNDFQKMAEALAPIVYGTRVDCAQCHDHPLAREIKQGHYWGLVAAFNRGKNTENGPAIVHESAIGGFINFTNLKKESQPAIINLLNGKVIEEERPAADAKQEDSPERYLAGEGKVPRFSRREALADAVTIDNPLLARAFVNYTWTILLGRGVVYPVDEINSRHAPSHPELLEWLGRDFAAHDYDMRRLVRAIVLSRVYQLSAPASTPPPPPETFAAALERPLMAEALARSVRIAAGVEPGDENLRQSFVQAFPDVLPRVPLATIQQAMLLANNEQVAALLKPQPGNAIEHLGKVESSEARVREIFSRALVREPDAEELAAAIDYLNARPAKPAEAAGELLWSLIAGPEFLTNH